MKNIFFRGHFGDPPTPWMRLTADMLRRTGTFRFGVRTVPALLLLLSAVGFCDDVQRAAVAGGFYPDAPILLSGEVDNYLKRANPPSVDGDIVALISPHAGYVYSGPVAAYGYKAVSGMKYDTVVIIGISHFVAFDGAAILDKEFYETPLGRVPIDTEFSKELIRLDKNTIVINPQAYEQEHSVEVQIPFLQKSLNGFKIVTLVIGRPDYITCKDLAEALVKAIKKSNKKVLIVASTDLSHYRSYNDAVLKDQVTISEILNFDPSRFTEKVTAGECELCGSAPVLAVLLASKALGADKIQLLKYANSADTAGDKTRVVGYASIAIYKEEKKEAKSMLSAEQRKRLLEIARETIEGYVNEGKVTGFTESDPALVKVQGAFVTLHKNGQLRGCIGNIIGREPLYLTVRDMAIESAAHDRRFMPVSAAELKDIDIEISVLSVPVRASDINEIEMGRHGVIVKRGFRSGVFLPQVADETGWTRDEFLSHLCSDKAGLPSDAWKDKDTELYIFTAEVFGDK